MNDKQMPIKTWLAVFILAISTFTMVTTELGPVGLLTLIAQDLSVSESKVGLTVSIYAWIGAISALLSSLALGSIPKRKLLILLTIVLIISNLLAAIASSYQILFTARIIGAFAHGAFWAIIGASVASIVPPNYIGEATSIVFGGVSVASVLGIPISNYIGTMLNWNMAFGLMCLLGVVSLIGIFFLVPPIKAESTVGLSAMKDLLKSRSLLLTYLATLLVVTAHFAAFTYIEPWLRGGTELSASLIPLALLLFGVAGIAGNFLTGISFDKYLKPGLLIFMFVEGYVLIFTGVTSGPLPAWAAMMLVGFWGLGISGIIVGLQTFVLKLAEEEAFTASALYVFCFNLAIGLGAVAGSWFVTYLSKTQLFLFSGCVTAVSIIAVSLVKQRD